MPASRPFLTTEWRYLLMLNYEIEPEVLAPYLPEGVELDLWEGKAIASMVGLLFRKTRLLGLPIPFHHNFSEVNLRFYVRQATPDGYRRGVVFIKEIVSKPWIARVANWVYGEHYVTLPMHVTVEEKGGRLRSNALVEYTWRLKHRVHRLGGLAMGDPRPIQEGSEEHFLTEQFWGFTRRGPRNTAVYQVAHPSWRYWPVAQPYFLSDVIALYGAPFEPFLHRRPRSAFLAEGSPVSIYPGKKIR